MKKISHYLVEKCNVVNGAFEQTDALDSFIDEDSLLFVDPLLIRDSKIKIFENAYEHFLQHFRNIIKLLLVSKQRNDLAWRSANILFDYKEKPEFGLGFTGSGKDGSGIGKKLRDRILGTISEILSLGINDPSIFELIGAFEEGIGSDRISDMTCSILYEYFLKYTEGILETLGVTFTNVYKSKSFGDIKVLKHPVNKKVFVVLVPKSLLKTLLVSIEMGNLENLSEQSSDLRQKLNADLGEDWKAFIKQDQKKNLKSYITRYPAIASKLLEEYHQSHPIAYDLSLDPDGEYRWYSDAYIALEENPFIAPVTNMSMIKNQTDLINYVDSMISHFKDLIEAKGLWRNLYRDEGKWQNPHREKYAQNLFRACTQFMCDSANLDLNPEVDGGNGPVDFKISLGAKLSVIVEIKKSTNTKLVHAVEKQVPTYATSVNAKYSIIVSIEVNKTPSNTHLLEKYILELKASNTPHPEVVYVDGLPKTPASI